MRKVVVLEDETTCMELFRTILARAGYTPLRAGTCFEVQQHLAGNAVDAMIVDLFLHTQFCHGTDVALRARSSQPGLKILFTSGTAFGDWSEADLRNVAALPEASWDILQKPFHPAELLAVLGDLLNRPPAAALVQAGCPHNSDCACWNPAGAGLPIEE